VPLAEPARAAVEDLVDHVRADLTGLVGLPPEGRHKRRTDVRWVRMDGLHLTLRFLGPTPADQIATLASVVDATAAESGRFEVAIRGGGAFPTATKPRTLWLGIEDGQEQMRELAANLSSRLEAVGWPAETRSFRGHLTLGRSDGRLDGRKTVALLVQRATAFHTRFEAARLVLYESITGGGPARYEPVHSADLEG
jgi:RNA 2',3'-cyclic 3'-phosphodiesterase